MGISEKICANCRAWKERVDKDGSGHCLRHPPVPIAMDGQIVTSYPLTYSGQTCFDFLANEKYRHEVIPPRQRPMENPDE